MLATALIAFALLGLAAVTAGAVVTIARSVERVDHARAIVVGYTSLQRAVAEEAFAEAAYRRAPTEAGRIRLSESTNGVVEAINEVRSAVGPEDADTLTALRGLNEMYVAEVRATLAAHPPEPGTDQVAGPALDSMQDMLDLSIMRHRATLYATSDEQRRLISVLAWVLPATFALAFTVVAWMGFLMVRAHGRLRLVAADNELRANSDPLTGVANRAGLVSAMDQVLSRPRTRASLLYLDLDRFKPINDTLGHHAGDLVLIEVARRLENLTRPGDVLARIGGDEFAIFLPRADDAEAVARRAVEALCLPYPVEGQLASLGVSVGVACSPADGDDAATLLRVADAALYAAKNDGRGQVRLSPTLARQQ